MDGTRRRRRARPEEAYIESHDVGLGATREDAVRKQADVVAGGVRTTSFKAVTQQFHGRNEARRPFPHELDPTRLRVMMGAEKRAEHVHAQLDAARTRKHDDDVRMLHELEEACEGAKARQQDGGKLKLGRIEQSHEWQWSGELHRRGQVASWNWAKSFHVLCNGILYAFTDSRLSATLIDAWPVLAGSFRRVETTAKAHPFAFSLTLGGFFAGDERSVLDTVELSAPTLEARAGWLRALETASLAVSKDFKDTVDKAAQVASVRERQAAAKRALIRYEPNGQRRA